MKILINCSVINSSGPIQVALSFLNECQNFPNEYYIVAGPYLENVLIGKNYPSNFHFYYTKRRLVTGIADFIKVRDILKLIEKEVKPDVVFSVFGPSYWKPRAKHIQGFATPQVLYPESPLFRLLSLKENIWWRFHRIVNLFCIWYESDAIILETNIMQKRLLERIPKIKTFVVPNTFSAVYNNVDIPSNLEANSKFKLLTLSSYKRHKNIEIIPKVIDELSLRNINNVIFNLTLPEEKFNSIIPEKYRINVVNLGVLHPDECPAAYAKVDAMFLPTLLEGFSASYPEAMTMSKPILTSNYDFAIEVCGEAAVYFDPFDPSSIADAIIKIMDSQKIRDDLILAGKDRLKIFGNASQRAFDYLKIIETNA